MAHTLAEIVDETFAAARGEGGWQFGVARTLAPQPPMRWRQDAPPTTPLAEERMAPDSASPPNCAAPREASAPDVPASAALRPVSATRREWAQRSPSLDALLSGLAAPAEAPATPPAESPAESPAEVYAKMTATDEPPAAIMGAEPASGAVAVPAPAPRSQRIVVRKVALLDGQRIAEARATRDVVITGAEREIAARIEAATDDARAEAARLLAALIAPESQAHAG
jgi:hypothetical protein